VQQQVEACQVPSVMCEVADMTVEPVQACNMAMHAYSQQVHKPYLQSCCIVQHNVTTLRPTPSQSYTLQKLVSRNTCHTNP
jgi:hypothetical protein